MPPTATKARDATDRVGRLVATRAAAAAARVLVHGRNHVRGATRDTLGEIHSSHRDHMWSSTWPWCSRVPALPPMRFTG